MTRKERQPPPGPQRRGRRQPGDLDVGAFLSAGAVPVRLARRPAPPKQPAPRPPQSAAARGRVEKFMRGESPIVLDPLEARGCFSRSWPTRPTPDQPSPPDAALEEARVRRELIVDRTPPARGRRTPRHRDLEVEEGGAET